MARDGLTFSFLGKAHPRWSTPWAALVVQGVAAIVMVLALRDFDTLTTYFVVVEWAALILRSARCSCCAGRWRTRRGRSARRAIRGCRWSSWSATVVGLAAIVWGEFENGNYTPMYGLAIAAAGFPVYQLWKRLTARPPQGASMRNAILTDKAPNPIGPLLAGDSRGRLHFPGRTGLHQSGDRQAGAGRHAQPKRSRRSQNIKAILEAAASSLDHVVKCNVYLRDINDFAAMNEVYATFFQAPYPARTTIQAGALPGGIAVEIECIARKPRNGRPRSRHTGALRRSRRARAQHRRRCRSAAATGASACGRTRRRTRSAKIAQMQLDAGAIGITVAKMGEAEVLPGDDVLIAYPLLKAKAAASARAGQDATRDGRRRFGRGRAAICSGIETLVEIDVGVGRARRAVAGAGGRSRQGLRPISRGFSTGRRGWTRPDSAPRAARVEAVLDALRRAGFESKIVSGGSTPGAAKTPLIPQTTEIRPGHLRLL